MSACGEHGGELVGRGRHHRRTECGQRGGVIVVVRRRPFVAEREQHDHLNAGRRRVRRPGAASVRRCRPRTGRSRGTPRVSRGRSTSCRQYASAFAMSVPPPSCTPNSTSTGSCRKAVRSVTDVSNAMNEVRSAGIWARTPPNSDAYTTLSAIEPDWSTAMTTSRARLRWRRPCPTRRSGTTRAVFGNPVTQVGRDRHRPVDVAGAGPTRARRPRERATHGLAGLVGEASLEVGEHLGDHLAGGRPRLVGEVPVEFDEQRDEVDVGFEAVEQLRFEQQLAQVEPLDGVALEDLHDRRREVAADVAEPAHDRRLRAAEPAGSSGAPPRSVGPALGSSRSYSAPSAASMRRSSP